MLTALAELPLTARVAVALAVGIAGGALAMTLHVPLPWMIGPLLASAAFNTRGARLTVPVAARSLGQCGIGIALGLYFTPDAVARLSQVVGALVAAVVFAMALGLLFAATLHRWAGLAAPTAFFAGAIGGATEMALQGERNGADVQSIVVVHSLRVVLVVVTLPIAYQWLQVAGSDVYVQGRTEVVWPGLALLFGCGALAGLLMRRLRSPNAWMLGPLFATIAFTASGHAPSSMPVVLTSGAQMLLGLALGTRFAPGFFARAPRLIAVVVVTTLAGIAVAAGFGWLLGTAAGIAPATAILATAPGGVAEMSLTAKLLKLGVPVVTSFQVVRVMALLISGGALYRVLAQRYGWPHDVATPVHTEQPGDEDD